MSALSLEIVTPDGVALAEAAVDVVVLRRRERRFELGSEIAVFPLHAPLLVRTPVAPLRYRKDGRTFHVALGGGFAEVKGNRVLVVTPRCERVPPDDPDPRGRAGVVCRGWRREARDLRSEMAGAPAPAAPPAAGRPAAPGIPAAGGHASGAGAGDAHGGVQSSRPGVTP